MTAILGISAFYHDSAAALVVDGTIVAAAQEERFSREKHDARFPARAIAFCLARGQLRARDLQYVAFYDKPLVKFERLLETYLSYAPTGFRAFSIALPEWLKRKLFMRTIIRQAFEGELRAPILFLDHHESHAASAFFPSPFDEAAILTADGVGEWSTATLGAGRGGRLTLDRQLQFPHSLGLLYSAFTYYCGFAVNSGEYKLMGLAPYGRPTFVDAIHEHLIDLRPDGSLWLDMAYFNYCQGLTMTGPLFHELFGGPPRRPDSPIQQRHMDLAASVQRVTEDCMLRSAAHLHERTGLPNLVMAGGVALNCVATGRLLREGPFDRIWVQPAAGDAGGALGAALFAAHQLVGQPRKATMPDAQHASYLGPEYSDAEIASAIHEHGAHACRFTAEDDLLDHVAGRIAARDTVGWFHGRSEFGPRALGARSILGDPRSAETQATINRKVKFRESFRPFAPSVLREHAHEWFDVRPGEDSAYMLVVAPVRESKRVPLSPADHTALMADPDLLRRVNIPRSSVPAITHVDCSARLQTVDERHGRYHRLLRSFHAKTGCPMVVNTSFNLSWEPIVQTPSEAYHTFMQSELDLLVLGDHLLRKRDQPLGLDLWATSGDGVPGANSPWADPLTSEPLHVTRQSATNPRTGSTYSIDEGIPRLFVPTDAEELDGRDVTEAVQQFYEKTPFPNYDDLDTPRALMEKARAGIFARLLNEQIPYGARVLEVGCGTGQMTNFLATAHRTAMGVDICLNSLRLAEEFRRTHGLERAAFAQMNLFRPALKRDFFDVVISNGVLHHTSDCRTAFRRIGRLVRPGGFLVVGLYNAYSRQVHYARRALYRWTGIAGRWLDPQFGKMTAAGKRDAWMQDQYCHPHETSHTLDELMRWMDLDGFTFVNSIPKPRGGPAIAAGERLFETRDPGTPFTRMRSQIAALGNGYQEGGFFVVIARRKDAGTA